MRWESRRPRSNYRVFTLLLTEESPIFLYRLLLDVNVAQGLNKHLRLLAVAHPQTELRGLFA